MFFWAVFYIDFLVIFQHTVFIDGFLILVKELGLLNNLGQWIRGLYVVGSHTHTHTHTHTHIVNNEENYE
jgi:hypothetical protein